MLLCFCRKIQVPIFIGWVSFLQLLLRCCICLYCMVILPSPDQIFCRFCCLNNFLLDQSVFLICCCWCRKIQGPIFIGWTSFLLLVTSLLHLLGLYRHCAEFRTNLLQVLLLNYFFCDQSVLLICYCCVSAQNCRCRNLSVGRVLWYFWVMFTFD